MDIILFWSAVSLYAVSAASFFIWLVFRKDPVGTAAFSIAGAGLAFHASALVLRWVEVGHGPYITRYEVFSSNAFVAIALYLATGIFIKQVRGIGTVVLPFSVLLLGYSALSLDIRAEAPITFKNWWLVIHIFFAKLAVSATLIASALALFFLMKRRRSDALRMLPATPVLEDLGYRFLTLALLFQSLMIAAGAIWANSSWGRFWGWDPIETWSLVTWAAFGLVLHLRRLHGMQGARGAYLTLAVFLLTLFAAYVVVFIAPTVHSSYIVR